MTRNTKINFKKITKTKINHKNKHFINKQYNKTLASVKRSHNILDK